MTTSDRIDVDTGQLAGIVKDLGDRARDAEGLIDDAKNLVNLVNSLQGSCNANVSLAWTYIQHVADGLFGLQREVAVRGIAIARSQCDSQLAEDITRAFEPPKEGGGIMGWIHTGLDGAGMVPFIGEFADGTNALIYIGEGDWKNAAISGAGLIPIGGQGATGARMVGRGVDAVRGLRNGARAADDLAVDLAQLGRHADDLPFEGERLVDGAPGSHVGIHDEHGIPSPAPASKGDKPLPGTPEHKQQAWERYNSRPNAGWSYERWEKSYEANIHQASKSHKMMDEYRDALGWPHREVTVNTEHGARRLDIAHADPTKKRAVEHKTGKQYRSEANLSEIQRDKWLVEDGWNIVWVFEKSKPSEPLQEELRKAGIPWVVE
jgi:hypothetical protein